MCKAVAVAVCIGTNHIDLAMAACTPQFPSRWGTSFNGTDVPPLAISISLCVNHDRRGAGSRLKTLYACALNRYKRKLLPGKRRILGWHSNVRKSRL